MTGMTFQEELDVLHSMLRLGTVRLDLGEHKYFQSRFVAEAIKEYEIRVTCCLALGTKLSPLEQLAVHLLRESAGLPEFNSAADNSMEWQR